MTKHPSATARLSHEDLLAEQTRARRRIAGLEAGDALPREDLISSLTQPLQDGFSLLSPEGVHLDVNPAFCAMVGYSHNELVGVGIPHPYWPPETRARIAADLRRRLDGETSDVEATFMHRSGKRFPVLIASSVMRDETGDAVCVFTTVRDTSELRRAQEVRRAGEERYHRLVDGMLEGLAHCRLLYDEGRPADCVYLAVNPAFERLTGLRDAVGRTISDLLPRVTDQMPELLERFGRIAAGGDPEEFDIDCPSLGRVFRVAAFSPANGEFVAVFQDVSAIRRAGEENALLRHALDVHRDGAYWTDADNRFIYVNDAACTLLGYERDELIGQSISLVNIRASSERLTAVWDLLRREGSYTIESLHRRKDGSLFPVEIATTRMVHDGKEYNCGIARDITERKRNEAELARSNKRLERALEGTVGALSATVELRDPYTAGHQRRVAMLAEAIASRLGWKDEALAALRIAAQVHDVGKIAVPAEILTKPGGLNQNELTLIQQHSQVGHDILTGIDFGLPVAQIVLQHHERLDGSGYPQALRGDAILQEARVLAIADVVEAMISHRPYRAALPLEEALSEIWAGAGVLYDSGAATACLELFREGRLKLPD